MYYGKAREGGLRPQWSGHQRSNFLRLPLAVLGYTKKNHVLEKAPVSGGDGDVFVLVAARTAEFGELFLLKVFRSVALHL